MPIDVYFGKQVSHDMCIAYTDLLKGPGTHWFVVDNTLSSTFIFDSYGTKSPTYQPNMWKSRFRRATNATDLLYNRSRCPDSHQDQGGIRRKGDGDGDGGGGGVWSQWCGGGDPT